MPRVFKNSKSWTPSNPQILANAENTSGWKKFRLLLWKNYKIQSRHHVQTFVEVVLPLIFTIVLVIVRDIVKSESVDTPTIYESYPPSNPPLVVFDECNEIFYAPKNEITDKLMNKMREDFFNTQRFNYTITGYNTEHEVEVAYARLGLQASLQNSTNVAEAKVSVLAGVIFTNKFEDGGKSFPKRIEYSLRFPAQQRSQFDLISERFGIKPAWFTEIAFPLFQFLGPRSKDFPSGGLPGYYAEGFLYLQQSIDRTLIRLFASKEDLEKIEQADLNLQRFPYPKYIEDKYLFALQGWLPLLTMLSFVYPVLNITKSVVHEKEKRLKESMKMMGLPNYLHWSAWFVKSFLFLTASVFLMTVLIKVRFSSSNDLAVLSHVDAGVLFFILFAFVFQVIAFSFMISTFSSTANSGATVAGVLWFIFFVPYIFIQPRYNLLTRGLKLGCCFFTNAPIALACQILCVFEGTGAGLQWSTFLQGSGPDDDFSMGDCVLMMLINAVMYFLIALYVEGVWPGEYGVPLPWNFPFTKWYWTNGVRHVRAKMSMPRIETKSNLFEAEPSGRAGVRIQSLSKSFADKWAVKDMTLNMYENQITALLGHNGAGKTTTMSMLTGLFPSTNGTAFINGYDINTDIRSVRSSLGICPQHDILFDELTVEEHLSFFCLLKGYPPSLVENEITRTLKSLGLEDKRTAQAHTLSGGMKRKLSVGIALCGGSKVVLLDEPTSGMDPSARRSTWDLIQMEKKGRTILLSTHFMEEADLLGDRIAIMAEGELQCCGSSLFLKKKYGGGYHLTIVKDDSCQVENITNLLKKTIPDVEIDQDVGAELSYSLPDDKSQHFPEMFHELETRKDELGIASYGASITTMEEVFIRVGREAERKITEEFEKTHPTFNNANHTNGHNSNGKHVQISMDHLNNITGSKTQLYKEDSYRNSGFILILQQLRAMLVKKLIYAVRKRLLLLGQLGIPVIYLVIVLGVLKTLPGLENPPPHTLALSRYEPISRTVTVVHCNDLTPACKGYKDYLHDMNQISEVTNETFISHVLDASERDLVRVNFKYIIGFEEREQNTSHSKNKIELVGFFNNQPFHTPPLAFNYLTNAILRAYTNYTVEITNFPLPYSKLDTLKQTGTLYTIGFQVGYNIGFGMSFLAASYVVFLVTERESRSKHLQFVSGLKMPIFWIANYAVDAFTYVFPCALLIAAIFAFQVEDFTSLEVMTYLVIIFATYGAAVIPFMYLWSFAFTIPSTGFTRMTMFNLFTGMATMLTFVIVSIPEFDLRDVAELLNDIFLIFPNYALGMGIVQLAGNQQLKEQCATIELEFLCDAWPDNFCCVKAANFLDFKLPGIGKNIVYLIVTGIVSFTVLILAESKVLSKILCFWRRNKQLGEESDDTDEALAVEDSDVTLENDRIRKTNLNQLFEQDNLILRDLTKRYGNFVAVDKLNLGVQRGQTFGLLGVNGAGKTSTFKMLTGDEKVTSGDAFLYSHSVRHDIENVHSNLGYCPQFDGIIPEMTGRETLRMFARLRGIRESEIDGMIKRLANNLIFSQHIDKEVQHYSGGNKRKLSTAMALVGNPPIVFLDEPTTGMDPVARRHLWGAIAQVRDSGTSVILTSHSMEECEALCSRLAIMVNGKFRCLGSPQHLKNKFGEGYTLIAQTTPTGVSEDFSRAHQELGRRRSSSRMLRKMKSAQKWEHDLDELREFIEECFPDSILKDIHPGFVHYHLVPSPGVSWGKIFEKMEIAKEKFNLDAYSVGQTSLEQVFFNFTKAQLNIEGTDSAKKPWWKF